MFMNFTRITIKGNRGQNSGKSEWKQMDLSLREVFMQEPQLDKVLRQGFLFVKADRIQNWSEQECRTV